MRAERVLARLDRALEWWCEQLQATVHPRLGGVLRRTAPKTALIMDEDGVTYARYKRGHYIPGVRDAWSWDGDGRLRLPKTVARQLRSRERVVLRIAPSIALTNRLYFPLGAEAHLAEVVAIQSDLYFPLRAELIYSDFNISGRNIDDGHIDVELAAMRRSHLDAMIAAVELEGHTVIGALLDRSDARVFSGLNFMREHLRIWQRATRRINVALFAVLLICLFVAERVLEGVRAQELSILNSAIAALATQEQQARALSHELAKLRGEAELTSSMRRDASALIVLEDLSERLPDDVWLRSLEFSKKAGEIRVSGQGRNATALLQMLALSKVLEEPTLRGAVTKDPEGFERFDLTAKLAKAPGS